MQPAPLTGTATIPLLQIRQQQLIDAARTPHGDNNGYRSSQGWAASRCSPHPSRGQQQRHGADKRLAVVDAARAPHGDSNSPHTLESSLLRCRCSPCPSRGQQQHTTFPEHFIASMQPVPLTGTATLTASIQRVLLSRCSPYPSRGQQPLRDQFCVDSGQMQPVPLTGTATRHSRPCRP